MMAARTAYPLGRDGLNGEVSVEVTGVWKGGTRVIKKYLEAKKGENDGIVIRNMA
jgi:hypothetical protein